jgi:hypothetical protein
MNHVQQYSTQESPSIVISGAREWKNGAACDLAEGILSGVCFALSEMGVEGAGGGFIGKWGARVRGGDDGAGDTRQQVRWRGVVLRGNGGGCAGKGAWGGDSAYGGGACM